MNVSNVTPLNPYTNVAMGSVLLNRTIPVWTSRPILERFRQWLRAQRGEVLPKSPLGEAIGYAPHNWGALVRYTEAGFLAIGNNVAEQQMKRIAIGRKSWLFV